MITSPSVCDRIAAACSGAQTSRPVDAGPVRGLLGGKDPPAALLVPITIRVMNRTHHAERDGYDLTSAANPPAGAGSQMSGKVYMPAGSGSASDTAGRLPSRLPAGPPP